MRKLTLNDLCILIVDCEHKTAPTTSNGYPSIRTPNVGRGRLSLENVNRISDETYRRWTKRAVPKAGDLIVAREAPLGNVAIIPKGLKVCLGQRTVLVRPDPLMVDGQYLTYFLLGDYTQGCFHAASTGATVPHLNMRDIRGLPIPDLPPLAIQRRIATILSAYDNLIENNTRRIAILEEMARRLYEEWFVHFRFPGHDAAKCVDSELGPHPDEWSVMTLDEVCQRITDGSHRSPPSTVDGFPMASVKDMTDWDIDIDNCRRIGREDYEELVRNDCRPRKGDVLIAKDGSYLKHTFAVMEARDLVVLSSIAILRPNEEVRSSLLALLLGHPAVVERMKGYVSGVAIPRIVLKDFRKFKITVPSRRLQDSWAAFAEPMLDKCRIIFKTNRLLSVTRDLLLPKLISSEISVSAAPMPSEIAAQ